MMRAKDWFHTAFYWVNIGGWIKLLLWVITDCKVRGLENVPRGGPFILVSNHLNLADPPILSTIVPRRVVWMAKKELLDMPVIGLLYRLAGTIPVRRFEADLRALRRCQEALAHGHVVGMFPEGTRSRNSALQRGHPGAALLAMRMGVPVVPAAIWGTESIRLPGGLFRRTRVNVAFGEGFTLPLARRVRKEQVEDGTDLIMRRIAALLPPDYRGVYAEGPPEPELRGERAGSHGNTAG